MKKNGRENREKIVLVIRKNKIKPPALIYPAILVRLIEDFSQQEC